METNNENMETNNENTEELKKLIGERLVSARKKLSFTQKEAVEELNSKFKIKLKQATLSSYENGNSLAPINTLKSLAIMYKVSIDWLCGLSDELEFKKEYENCSDVISEIFNLVTKSRITKIEKFKFTRGNKEYYYRLKFDETSINEYLEGLSKMVELNESEAIDNELLELWQEKMLSKYNHEIIVLPF